MKVCVIGGGLAGCESAYKIAQSGYKVDLFEMRPFAMTSAHTSGNLAELVCSNSLGAKSIKTASGLLKKEMQLLGSLTIFAAKRSEVEAGRALAVDRNIFSLIITKIIESHPNINVIRQEVKAIPKGYNIIVIASGPLTSLGLQEDMACLTGKEYLYFYDAIAPHVLAESVDFSKGFFSNRYEETKKDYFNCILSKQEYERFYEELVNAQCVPYKNFENPKFFEGCMPVEELARRGKDTLRFGPMKPVGFSKSGFKSYAIVQLRKENKEGSILSLVGFQTKLTYEEQKRVFCLIPALSNAEFVKLGSMHRNTFIQSQHLLNKTLNLKEFPHIFFAGQITGVEGYTASAATGIIVGINVVRMLKNQKLIEFPKNTILGGLIDYITTLKSQLQPMGPNFGLLPAKLSKIEKAKISIMEVYSTYKLNNLI